MCDYPGFSMPVPIFDIAAAGLVREYRLRDILRKDHGLFFSATCERCKKGFVHKSDYQRTFVYPLFCTSKVLCPPCKRKLEKLIHRYWNEKG